MAEQDNFKRLPSVFRRISEIKQEDIRISLIGTVLDKSETTIAVDDGSGKIEITFEEPVKTEVNKLVRVFGTVVPMDQGFQLRGEILQDMSKLDLGLYKKAMSI
ncbi:MAG: replication protein RepA [Candidatus Aenigmatarchaeota archaeon]